MAFQEVEAVFKDTNLRAAAKTFTYRLTIAAWVFALYLLMIGTEAWAGLVFTFFLVAPGIVTFFIHERLWNMIPWLKNGKLDTHWRTIAKTVTWRLLSLAVVAVLVKIITQKSAVQSAEFSLYVNAGSLALHYVHERLWNMVDWERRPADGKPCFGEY